MESDGTYDYEYDAEGNRTKQTSIASGDYRTFTWDHRNRLIAVTDYVIHELRILGGRCDLRL